MGATVVVDPRERDLHDVQAEVGMVEGFDVALERSGNATALRAARIAEGRLRGARRAERKWS